MHCKNSETNIWMSLADRLLQEKHVCSSCSRNVRVAALSLHDVK